MTSTKRWADTADSADLASTATMKDSASVTVRTTSGDVHEFFGTVTEQGDLGARATWPMATVLRGGTLQVYLTKWETYGTTIPGEHERREHVLSFAAGAWQTVTGPGFHGESEPDLTPAHGWWAAFHYGTQTDTEESWNYAPVVGWQTINRDGLPGLTAWIVNAKDGELVRLDRLRTEEPAHKLRCLTQHRPDGSNDWAR